MDQGVGSGAGYVCRNLGIYEVEPTGVTDWLDGGVWERGIRDDSKILACTTRTVLP